MTGTCDRGPLSFPTLRVQSGANLSTGKIMDRLPPLRLLTTFEAVSRLGSMREAAARLNVTQPAVSQALKALEDHVGAGLIDRSTRPASLMSRKAMHTSRFIGTTNQPSSLTMAKGKSTLK